MKPIKKVVLAYSGGLDTSVILRWLIETYHCEVVAWCADVGQAEELSGLEKKAKEAEHLREFIDRTTFSGDQRDSNGELSSVDQHPADTHVAVAVLAAVTQVLQPVVIPVVHEA